MAAREMVIRKPKSSSEKTEAFLIDFFIKNEGEEKIKTANASPFLVAIVYRYFLLPQEVVPN